MNILCTNKKGAVKIMINCDKLRGEWAGRHFQWQKKPFQNVENNPTFPCTPTTHGKMRVLSFNP